MTDKDLRQWMNEQTEFAVGLIIEVLNEQVREDMASAPVELRQSIHNSALFHALGLINKPSDMKTEEEAINYISVVNEQGEEFRQIVDKLRNHKFYQRDTEVSVNLN